MAIIQNNPLINQASGSVGKQFIYKKYYDKTVLSVMPDMSKRVLSKKQIESNERMALATIYARYIYSTPEGKIKARIRLKVPLHKSLFHALVKEHLDTNRQLPLAEVKSEPEKDLY
ncbi:MAG: hypothetical protein ABIR18_09530 [Chitinophagaceae bacterium]